MQAAACLTAILIAGSPTWVTKPLLQRRIEELVDVTGLSESQLSVEAGMSHFTLGKWIAAARNGERYPGLFDKVMGFVQRYGRTINWLIEEDPAPAGHGLLQAQAQRVVALLVDVDKVTEDEAAALVNRIKPPPATELDLYRLARTRLDGLRLSPSGAGDGDGPLPTAPVFDRRFQETFVDQKANTGKSRASGRSRNAGKKRQKA